MLPLAIKVWLVERHAPPKFFRRPEGSLTRLLLCRRVLFVVLAATCFIGVYLSLHVSTLANYTSIMEIVILSSTGADKAFVCRNPLCCVFALVRALRLTESSSFVPFFLPNLSVLPPHVARANEEVSSGHRRFLGPGHEQLHF
eukprot:scaffold31_cov263-Pinguiococcus_pyrenoidosus.AAC.22